MVSHPATPTPAVSPPSPLLQGMGDMLTSAMQASPPELQSQLKYILVQLSSGEPSIEGNTMTAVNRNALF